MSSADTPPHDVAKAWLLIVAVSRDTGGDRWAWPKLTMSCRRWGVAVRFGWRWTAIGLHVGVSVRDLGGSDE